MNSGGIPMLADEVYAEKQDQLREAMIQKFDELIAVFSASRVKEESLVLSTSGIFDWNKLEDGVYNISAEGYITDGHNGLLLKPGDVLLIKGNYALVFTTTTAAKLHYDEDCARYHYVSKIIVTKELLTEVLSELNQQHEVTVIDDKGETKTIQEIVNSFFDDFSTIKDDKQDKLEFGEGLNYDNNTRTVSLDKSIIPKGEGASAEHEHAINEVYIPIKTGGEFDTDAYNIADDIRNAVKADAKAMSILNATGYTVDGFGKEYFSMLGEPATITGSDGSTYIGLSLTIPIPFAKSRIAPKSNSLYDVKYGVYVKNDDLESLFSSGEVEAEDSGNEVVVSILNKSYEYTKLVNVTEVLSIGEEIDTETADSLIEKYAGKSIALTVLSLNDQKQEIAFDENFDYKEVMERHPFMMMVICLVPIEDVQDLMSDDMGEVGLSVIKLHFDEIEPEELTKKSVLKYIDEKGKELSDSQVSFREVTENEYENLSENEKEDSKTLFLITEE